MSSGKRSSEKKHRGGVLSDKKIKKASSHGEVIIRPYNQDQVGNSSYDITLGENFFRCNTNMEYLNPWSKHHVEKYWGLPLKASEAKDEEMALKMGLEVGQKYIELAPGEIILAHTNEFIGGVDNYTTMLKARSSCGRCFVSICNDAGWGDIGYVNRWTLEIKNGNNVKLILPVNSRVGQIVFIYAGKCEKKYSGKYQEGNNTEEMMKNWTPELMVPKAYQDKKLPVLNNLLENMLDNKYVVSLN